MRRFKGLVSILLVLVLLVCCVPVGLMEAVEDTPAYSEHSKGSKGDAVKALQQKLIDRHFMAGVPDGDYGKKTEYAIRCFQDAVGIEPTGIADAETQTMLFDDDLRIASYEFDAVLPFTHKEFLEKMKAGAKELGIPFDGKKIKYNGPEPLEEDATAYRLHKDFTLIVSLNDGGDITGTTLECDCGNDDSDEMWNKVLAYSALFVYANEDVTLRECGTIISNLMDYDGSRKRYKSDGVYYGLQYSEYSDDLLCFIALPQYD